MQCSGFQSSRHVRRGCGQRNRNDKDRIYPRTADVGKQHSSETVFFPPWRIYEISSLWHLVLYSVPLYWVMNILSWIGKRRVFVLTTHSDYEFRLIRFDYQSKALKMTRTHEKPGSSTALAWTLSAQWVALFVHRCSKKLHLKTGQDRWTCWPWAPISIFDPQRDCSVFPTEVTSYVMVNSWGPTPLHVIQQAEWLLWQREICVCTALTQPLPASP